MPGSVSMTNISRIAGADLSAAQFCGVKLNASGQVVLAGAGEAAIGILQNKPTSGQIATVCVAGVSFMKAGGVVAPGFVTTNASGRAATPTTGQYILGSAIEAAAANGEAISVLVNQAGAKA